MNEHMRARLGLDGRHIQFTAADLIEGLGFLEVEERRWVLFYLELDHEIAPMSRTLQHRVSAAFGGMSCKDLHRAYQTMVWIDGESDLASFTAVLGKVLDDGKSGQSQLDFT